MTPFPGVNTTQCCLVSSVSPSVRPPTERGRCLLPDDQGTKTGQPVEEVVRETHPDMRVPSVENPTYAVFEKEVPETVPLNFREDDVTWFALKLSGAVGALRAEAMEIRNLLLRFRCTSEELRVVVARLAEFVANSYPHWAAYCVLI